MQNQQNSSNNPTRQVAVRTGPYAEERMTTFEMRQRSWRKLQRRGVSPIIATILLVAITVVLAAVLYVLISGLTGGGTSTPYSLQMSNQGQSTPAAGTYWITLAINPTSGLTTGLFGLKVTNVVNIGIAAGTPTATCITYAAFTVAKCAAPAAN